MCFKKSTADVNIEVGCDILQQLCQELIDIAKINLLEWLLKDIRVSLVTFIYFFIFSLSVICACPATSLYVVISKLILNFKITSIWILSILIFGITSASRTPVCLVQYIHNRWTLGPRSNDFLNSINEYLSNITQRILVHRINARKTGDYKIQYTSSN